MMRSLYSGISGLKSHQTKMDVVGNNIANVNTTGFKAGRTTFADALSQQVSGATRPGGLGAGMGGTNALEIGMGAAVASVDTMYSQGNLQSTGNTTDLAIEGDAFFVVGDGQSRYYTRDGAFSLDANGQLVMANGLVLQGLNANDLGEISDTALVESINIPLSTQSPANATTTVEFGRNLDADSIALGSVTYSKRFLTDATLATAYSGLYDSDGNSLGMKIGDILTFSGTSSAGSAVKRTFTVDSATDLETIRSEMQNFLRTEMGSAGATVTLDATTGGFTVTAGATAVNDLQVSSNRPVSSPLITNAFQVDSRIAAGGSESTLGLRQAATSSTLVADLYDEEGNVMGLQDGDVISFAGAVNGKVDPATPLTYNSATTTMADLMEGIRNQLRLPQTDGTTNQNLTVSMNAPGSDDNIPDGTLVIRGLPETAFQLSDISIQASNSNNASPAPSIFNTNMSFTDFQKARDTGVVATSITVYDDAGFSHDMTVTFTHSQQADQWLWDAATNGSENIVAGASGTITFGTDGTVSNFAFTDGSSTIQIDPQNGAGVMSITLDPGGPGSYNGLTQFSSDSTAAALSQDGYTMGKLKSISVGGDGLISGAFDNGMSRSLAQLVVADFTNPEGLSKQSESVYAATANSGDPVLGRASTQSSSVIKPGTLEMSNVDIAAEFTEMITTQRGYQANARVISTSDKFLEELVNLVR